MGDYILRKCQFLSNNLRFLCYDKHHRTKRGKTKMSQYNILVVDDDREIVRSLGKLLELEGYRVKKAYNGMEALDILMTEQIHLILLDVMMPKMNGLSALMKIREKNNIPIIMLPRKPKRAIKSSDFRWAPMIT